MLDTLLMVAAIIAGPVTILLLAAAMRPDQFRVARSVTVLAPPDRAFALINDLRQMNSWNPFDRRDPTIKGTYSGPESGVGARYDFDGTKAGAGSIEITEAVPVSRVAMRLLMSRPIACDNRVEFLIEPAGPETRVTWAMSGKVHYFGRILHMVCSMDSMIGGVFETGLADLKALAESRQAA